MAGLNETPSGNRLHIGVFGKTNSGKSSFINRFSGQNISIVANVAGTTTDPVYKAMEVYPLGPCTLIDTAGFDDATELGEERLEKTRLAAEKADIAIILLADADMDALDYNIKKQQRSLEQKDRETFLELDNEFHELLFRAADKMWSYHIIKEQMVHFDRLRSLSTKSKQHDYVLKDHEDILYAIRRHDSEMAEMLMTRHLTRHLSEKKELLTMYPDYFTNN